MTTSNTTNTSPSSDYRFGERVYVLPSEMDVYSGTYFVSGPCGRDDLKLARNGEDPADWDLIVHVSRIERVAGTRTSR